MERWVPPESVALRWESNPRHAAWEAAVLPLNYARDGSEIGGGRAGRQGGGFYALNKETVQGVGSDVESDLGSGNGPARAGPFLCVVSLFMGF